MRAAARRRPTRRPDSRCAARYASPMQELVDLIARHGVALVFLNVLLEQLGLPVPAVPTLIVAGAVFGVAVLACYIGDGLWFAAGRLYGRRVMSLLCRISLSPDSCVRQSEYQFERWGKAAIVVSKFVPALSTVTPPLAGAMRMGWPTFIVLNGIGIALWSALPIGLGMLFADQVDRAIPGALVIGVGDVEARLHDLPRDRDIIFYCSCPNEASAALVAKKLIQLGYKRVRPLAGGLDAWLAAGHDVELRPPDHSGVT